jgi:hypothetical protein
MIVQPGSGREERAGKKWGRRGYGKIEQLETFHPLTYIKQKQYYRKKKQGRRRRYNTSF